MNPQTLIRTKRDGLVFSSAEIEEFIRGVTDNSWADYQITALVMAMFINGLNLAEQNALTKAMLNSGEVFDFSEIEMPKADKHSTGGVGDKTSLLIAPVVASCGVAVPMISGRGLGHTGGTLDKLESIPGYRVNLTKNEFRKIVGHCGFAMAGQTAEIVPADKKLYALRDATATVESIPMIVGSIMSKKLAEGLDALVLDVKTGTGAFMEEEKEAEKLARALVETGKSFGVRTEALITDMNQPLGRFVGNSHEVFECIKLLRNEGDDRMRPTLELSLELSARMLVLTGVAGQIEEARKTVDGSIRDGRALEKFRQNIELQGGDPQVCDRPGLLLEDGIQTFEIRSATPGFIGGIDTKSIGEAIGLIGGGRIRAEDSIDPAVGFSLKAGIGDQIRADETLGQLHCRDDAQFRQVREKLRLAFKISGENNPTAVRLIKAVITG